jgi:putative tryptophan/tyrosine transport system substrate-binding protein
MMPIRRRDFISAIGGGALAWPLAARAQQPGQVRRVGVLHALNENDVLAKAEISAFMQGLSELGWTEGRNLRMDFRWLAGDFDRLGRYAKELVDLQPDVILAHGTPSTAALQRETRTIPIVFVVVSDPVGSGFIAGLPRPGGNITGFVPHEPTLAGKWLQMLTEIAPAVRRVAAVFNPDTAPASYCLPSFAAAARSLKVEPIAAPVRNDADIEMVISALGREPKGGFVSMPDAFTVEHRASIIALAARYNVPSIYNQTTFVKDGGLLSYGASFVDIYHRAASYVDRILRGAKPADLPAQFPVKFESAVNARTAKALGLTVPPSILLRVDEVIE